MQRAGKQVAGIRKPSSNQLTEMLSSGKKKELVLSLGPFSKRYRVCRDQVLLVRKILGKSKA